MRFSAPEDGHTHRRVKLQINFFHRSGRPVGTVDDLLLVLVAGGLTVLAGPAESPHVVDRVAAAADGGFSHSAAGVLVEEHPAPVVVVRVVVSLVVTVATQQQTTTQRIIS